jgi:hypothetical protein
MLINEDGINTYDRKIYYMDQLNEDVRKGIKETKSTATSAQ